MLVNLCKEEIDYLLEWRTLKHAWDAPAISMHAKLTVAKENQGDEKKQDPVYATALFVSESRTLSPDVYVETIAKVHIPVGVE
jgi:hypothetical protein